MGSHCWEERFISGIRACVGLYQLYMDFFGFLCMVVAFVSFGALHSFGVGFLMKWFQTERYVELICCDVLQLKSDGG